MFGKLARLAKYGITVQPDKCEIAKPEVKWFGYIFSKKGMSPDPSKCEIIKSWPSLTSMKEVESFLQTVQFNSKFLGSINGVGESYPELTAPLQKLTHKNANFVWGHREEVAFNKMQ